MLAPIIALLRLPAGKNFRVAWSIEQNYKKPVF
jgi:hypothetical protein